MSKFIHWIVQLGQTFLANILLFLYRFCVFEFEEKYEEKFGEPLSFEISLDDTPENKADICIELDHKNNINMKAFWASRDQKTLQFFSQLIYTLTMVGLGESVIKAIENGIESEEDLEFYTKLNQNLTQMLSKSMEQQDSNPIINPLEVFKRL